jgi:hypothetical protein
MSVRYSENENHRDAVTPYVIPCAISNALVPGAELSVSY